MSYRETVLGHLGKARQKKRNAGTQAEQHRWDWVMKHLIADLKDYESGGQERWGRTPVHFHPTPEEFFKEFFSGFMA